MTQKMKWSTVASKATKLKREQLYREIMDVDDVRVRDNLEHTYYKLFSFLDDDLYAWGRDRD